MSSSTSFSAHQGSRGLEFLLSEWQALLGSFSARVRFFHQPHWYQSYLESGFPDPDCVWFVAARRAGKLVAVFPLQYQDYRVGMFAPRVLGNLENDQLQLCDFIYDQVPENGNLLVELARWLRGSRDFHWHVLRLRKVPDDAALAYSARVAMPAGTLKQVHDGSNWVDTSQGYDLAIKPASTNFKQDFRRLTRRAEKTHPLRLQSCTTPEELQAALAHFLDIESSGWKGDQGISGAILCDPAMLAFYQAVVRNFGERDECVINLLWYGDSPIAGQLCVRERGVLNILKVGFREEFAEIAPGVLLLDRVIRLCADDPAIDTLHLVNEPPWARKLKPRRMDVCSYVIPNNVPMGWLVLGGLLIKRRMDDLKALRSQGERAPQAAAATEAALKQGS